MKLLDTSVSVDHLRGRRAATTLVREILAAEGRLAASEITRFELLAGARESERAGLDRFFEVLDWVPVTEEITRRAGGFARSYRHSHTGIGVADYVIAATAAVLDAELLTTNVRHFPMFDSLAAPYSYG
jgi:hypothetical protein